MTLRELMWGFLNEGVSNNEINNAIDNHKYVVVNYQGTDGTHTGKRMIQPVAFGLTTAGHPVIRAFERFGDTKTEVPKWKYLRVDRISSWNETDKTFNEPAELFNPNDDKTMSVVYNIAKFDNNDEIQEPPTSSPKLKSDEKPNVFKTDTERKLERLKKQLDNPLTLSDFKTKDGFENIGNNNNQSSGPKTKQDTMKGSDDVYTDEYNYNTFDDSLSAAGKKTKRNGNYYYQNRKNGKFAKGSILDDEVEDDTEEIENYLNRDNGNRKTLDSLREALGDISSPITLRELKERLRRI